MLAGNFGDDFLNGGIELARLRENSRRDKREQNYQSRDATTCHRIIMP
jgi:hypothetical protein